eukprot:TRINITY_DN4111_c0_g1_i1.p1 TRINITY_DN4111_c0_g1~~TRINITY_DN4111_c0_g1_i1.p1  ORF type:complete len:261 (+),score=37.56 TRINITY_DN4111_c0_g1_i1:445-1227(+)
MFYGLSSLNKRVVCEIEKQGHRSILKTMLFSLSCASLFLLPFFALHEYNIWRVYLFLEPSIPIEKFSNCLVIALIADCCIAFLSMFIKCHFLAIFPNKMSKLALSQLYNITELTTHLFRTLIPIGIWSRYIFSWDTTSFLSIKDAHPPILALSFLYLLLKGKKIFKMVTFLYTAISHSLHGEVFGRPASQDESQEQNICPICQDSLDKPIILSCHHIFCEDCIGEWLSKQNSCPMCRSSIENAGFSPFCSGATSLLVSPI